MPKRILCLLFVPMVISIVLAGCGSQAEPPMAASKSQSYDDLTALFQEWREFQKPKMTDWVADYSAPAMRSQSSQLPRFQERLRSIDPSGWPIAQQVDFKIVEAEMSGLDFDHRVRRPWSRNPAFYTLIHSSRSDVPAHEGPHAVPEIDIWAYDYPLTNADAATLSAQVKAIGPLLRQARSQLVEDARGLWMGGIRAARAQSNALERWAQRVSEHAELSAAIDEARRETDDFHGWLEEQLPSKTGPSGVGKDNYSWYLQKVQLIPYTWEEEVTLMRRELVRSHAALRLEEHRNRNLPELKVVDSEKEFDERFGQSVDDYMAFLREGEVMTVRDYFEPALRARLGSYSASTPRGFFSQVSYRSPLAMRTHMQHWIELAVLDNSPHSSPMRSTPLIYNMYAARSEGLATGIEEMAMHAGLFEGKPRERELIWIMLAQRAARAIAGLMVHGNEWTMEEACDFAARWTPRGWMPADSNTVWGEQHLYLQQPSYGTSYLVGKIEIEQLMAELADEWGDDYSMKRFMDEFRAIGLIPVSLIRWEMTGNDHDIRRMEGY